MTRSFQLDRRDEFEGRPEGQDMPETIKTLAWAYDEIKRLERELAAAKLNLSEIQSALRELSAMFDTIHDRHCDNADCDEDASGHRTPNRDMHTMVDCNIASDVIRKALRTAEGVARVEPDIAEFEVYDGGEFYAGAYGPREQALAEARGYASQCDGPVRIDEVTRRVIESSQEPSGAK